MSWVLHLQTQLQQAHSTPHWFQDLLCLPSYALVWQEFLPVSKFTLEVHFLGLSDGLNTKLAFTQLCYTMHVVLNTVCCRQLATLQWMVHWRDWGTQYGCTPHSFLGFWWTPVVCQAPIVYVNCVFFIRGETSHTTGKQQRWAFVNFNMQLGLLFTPSYLSNK